MAEYIDKNKLKEEIFDVYNYEYPTASGEFDEFATWILPNIINQMPTIEIVTCKECKHSKLEDWDGDKFRICTKDNHIREGGWFCADGERKSDE